MLEPIGKAALKIIAIIEIKLSLTIRSVFGELSYIGIPICIPLCAQSEFH